MSLRKNPLEFINEKLSGCGHQSEKLEAAGIIQEMITAYSAGELSEEEIRSYAKQLCEGLSSIASDCGKSWPVDQCVEEIIGLVKSNIDFTMLGLGMRVRLAKRRAGGSSGGLSLL